MSDNAPPNFGPLIGSVILHGADGSCALVGIRYVARGNWHVYTADSLPGLYVASVDGDRAHDDVPVATAKLWGLDRGGEFSGEWCRPAWRRAVDFHTSLVAAEAMVVSLTNFLETIDAHLTVDCRPEVRAAVEKWRASRKAGAMVGSGEEKGNG